MAVQRYVLDYGSANAGGAPAFDLFARLDTLVALAQPTIVEIGAGEYYFDYDWSTAPTGLDTILFKATLNGVELSDTISGVPPPGALIPGASPTADYGTALYVIDRVSKQVGTGPVVDAYGSTDPNVVQMCDFLIDVGDDLLREANWQHLSKEFTFVTTPGQTYQALPADFHDLLDQTPWNRSARLPALGPVSSQESSYLKAILPAITISVIYRLQPPNLIFPTSPPSGATVALEYLSSYWVGSAGSVTPDKAEPTANDDLLYFDPTTLIRGVKVKWLTTKGFDTTVAVDDYEKALEHAMARNSAAPVLSMANAGRIVDRFLNSQNIPITRYGM